MAEKKVNIKLVALLALSGLLIAMIAAPWVFRVTSQLDLTKAFIFRKVFNRVFLVSEVLVFLAFWKKLGIEIPYKIYYKRQHIKNEFGSWVLVAIITIALIVAVLLILMLLITVAAFFLYRGHNGGDDLPRAFVLVF